ncbi:DNA-binding transcriptional MerR regulator [Massilia aurea]|uniref:DNA-binding transcriptional MerR regulator n=1 Tax=Massilia aurea TaxID=373040 RepID=A0A7W9U6U9_9BURK|nr:MerR family transcriptional regulator [Massilia aurea]MBB6132667.1 DNA-binding transcriptional MerR regulator [Massilia aurea]
MVKKLNSSEAASELGVSTKALRLYEQKGLVNPERTSAGYRAYSPEDMVCATKVVALRNLGLSLSQVAEVFDGDPQSLQSALLSHDAFLNEEMGRLIQRMEKVRSLQSGLALGRIPSKEELSILLNPEPKISLTFLLPWPWGGEQFEIRNVRPLNYIVGPVGSGKTVFAHCIANALAGGVFIEPQQWKSPQVLNGMHEKHSNTQERVSQAITWLVGEGAMQTVTLTNLLQILESSAAAILVVDLIEDDLDEASQGALIRYLRRRAQQCSPPLFLITRSSTILDLDAVGYDEAIYSCLANHSPPTRVLPYRGSAGYEYIASCLASPDVRARTQGMIASIHVS